MADTIYFLDGSREVLFSGVWAPEEQAGELERILQERLGEDTAKLFGEIVQMYKEEIDRLEDELADQERASRHRRTSLGDILESLQRCQGLLASPRLDRRRMNSELIFLRNILSNA